MRCLLPVLAIALPLLASACGGSSDAEGTGAQGSITGVEWQWQETLYNDDTSATPENPASYTITFAEDGTFSGQADCNRINGSFTLDGSSISLAPIASTRMLCPPGSLFDQFVRDLEGVAIVTLQDGDLLADIMADVGTMRFSPAP